MLSTTTIDLLTAHRSDSFLTINEYSAQENLSTAKEILDEVRRNRDGIVSVIGESGYKFELDRAKAAVMDCDRAVADHEAIATAIYADYDCMGYEQE